MIIPNLSQILSGAAGAALAGSMVWLAWGVDSAATAAFHERELVSVEADLIRQCDKQARINEGVINDLRKNVSATDDNVRSLELRLKKSARVHTAAPACGVDGADHVGADERDGGLVSSLPRYAGECEGLKAKIQAWQAWATGVEKNN